MIDRRRWPRPMPGAVQMPLPSGPRWASTSVIAAIRAGSTGLGTSGWKRPAMPHIRFEPSQPGGAVGERSDRAERAQEIVDRRARIAGDEQGHRALRAAEQPHLHRLDLHPHPASGPDIADTVEADDLPLQPVRGDPFRPSVRRCGSIRGPRPAPVGPSGALPEADQLPPLLLADEDGDGQVEASAPRVAVALDREPV